MSKLRPRPEWPGDKEPINGGIVALYQLANLIGWLLLAAIAALAGRAAWKRTRGAA